MNHTITFFDRDNKTKLVPACISYFLESFSLKSVVIITVVIALHYKETNYNCLIYIAVAKKQLKIQIRGI